VSRCILAAMAATRTGDSVTEREITMRYEASIRHELATDPKGHSAEQAEPAAMLHRGGLLAHGREVRRAGAFGERMTFRVYLRWPGKK